MLSQHFPSPIRFSQQLAATRQDGIRMGREARAMLSNVHCRQEGLGRDYGVHEEYISIRPEVRTSQRHSIESHWNGSSKLILMFK